MAAPVLKTPAVQQISGPSERPGDAERELAPAPEIWAPWVTFWQWQISVHQQAARRWATAMTSPTQLAPAVGLAAKLHDPSYIGATTRDPAAGRRSSIPDLFDRVLEELVDEDLLVVTG